MAAAKASAVSATDFDEGTVTRSAKAGIATPRERIAEVRRAFIRYLL